MNETTNEMAVAQNSRQIQAERTKAKLLDVSMRLIREKTFAAVKITDICREANVSVGAFYYHLKNKAGIVIAMCVLLDQFFEEKVFPKFKDRNDAQAVSDYLAYMIQYSEDSGLDLTIEVCKAQLTEGINYLLSVDRPMTKGLIDLLRRLQDRAVIKKDKTAEQIADELLTIAQGILYYWCQTKGGFDGVSFAKETLNNYVEHYKV